MNIFFLPESHFFSSEFEQVSRKESPDWVASQRFFFFGSHSWCNFKAANNRYSVDFGV